MLSSFVVVRKGVKCKPSAIELIFIFFIIENVRTSVIIAFKHFFSWYYSGCWFLKWFRKLWETPHEPENAPEVRLILRALSLPITYDIIQQNFPICSVKLNIAFIKSSPWLFLFMKKKEIKEIFYFVSLINKIT